MKSIIIKHSTLKIKNLSPLRLVGLLCLAAVPVILSGCGKAENKSPAAYVNPFIGTAGHGHTYPGAMVPFGMVQLSPDTRKDNWDACSGYHYSDDHIYGFSHTHLSGTGVGDYGDIRFLPWSGDAGVVAATYRDHRIPRARFSHDNEHAEAGYYRVKLDSIEVEAELTVGKRFGMHRYRFEKDAERSVILDLYEGATSDRILDLELNIINDSTINGLKRTDGWSDDQYVFFYAVFSEPFASYTVFEEGEVLEGKQFNSARDLKCIFSFGDGEGELMVKVGISAVDHRGAQTNLLSECTGWDFDGVRQQAFRAWDSELGRIVVEGGTEARKVTFYTALYHAFLAPYLYSDADGRYRGHDMQIHRTQGEMYTVFSLWDTFRALHPLFTIVQQERTGHLINSMLDIYDKGGLLPVWELAANETWCMIGYHAVPVIADAYVKGLRNYDAEKAFEAMKKSSMQDHHGLEYYRKYGYIPAGMEGESVSKTLEYAYDDWCIAVMANALGKDSDHDTYLQRAQYYKNLFDPSTGFIRGRMNGMWATPFDPAEVNFMLTEANTWQYTFFVPQDVSGMMALLGGPDRFVDKLDEMFTATTGLSGRQQSDITGLIGQYAHGNEPSHHMAYLYNFAGQPWKTQDLVRRIMDEQYSDKPDGLCGNEDCGQMSAWYVLSAMGFYPVTPGTDQYITGSPIFDRVTINLENGRQCVIEAGNNSGENRYIRSATLNGEPYHQSYISHADIMNGGHFLFEMGPEPNRKWGSGTKDRPVTAITEQLITPAPYLIAGSRTFTGEMSLGMGCLDSNAVIRYTLDGTLPDNEAPIYESAIRLNRNTVVKAFAAAEGRIPSKVVEGTFSLMPEGRSVTYHTAYDPQYTAGGDQALIDLIRGSSNFRTGSWQGFHGVDVEAVVDLADLVRLEKITAGFLQDQNSWIFMPEYVEFSISTDGHDWDVIGRENNLTDAREDGGIVHEFSIMMKEKEARFVKVFARNRAVCPEWHPGAGQKAWLFVDEIGIE
jgi:predicted alpha-1,2-mannosidase